MLIMGSLLWATGAQSHWGTLRDCEAHASGLCTSVDAGHSSRLPAIAGSTCPQRHPSLATCSLLCARRACFCTREDPQVVCPTQPGLRAVRDQSFAPLKLPLGVLVLSWLRNKTQKEHLIPSLSCPRDAERDTSGRSLGLITLGTFTVASVRKTPGLFTRPLCAVPRCPQGLSGRESSSSSTTGNPPSRS